KVVLYIIFLGIIVLLLESRRTIFSQFKIPLNISTLQVYKIKKGINLYSLLKYTTLII
ncbi:hypothetical protein B0H65DRAFT_436465, partial [Neurospora tetraspora]